MKKLLLFFTFLTFIQNLNAQCTVAVQTVNATFTGTVLPTCWTSFGTVNALGTEVRLSSGSGFNAYLMLPKTNNARGILTFDVRRNTSTTVASPVQVGVVLSTGSPNSSFVQIQTVNTTYTMTTYTVNLSSYTGAYQYIALRSQGPSMVSGDNAGFTLDNVNYISGCESSSVIAVAQDYTLTLNSLGTATLGASQINNGSSSGCGSPTLSISKTTFNCSNLGLNTVTLTAVDNMSNTATSTCVVNVKSSINDESISSTNSVICAGNSATISTGSSVSGVAYYLRSEPSNSVIAGPINGTGSSLNFNTGVLNNTSGYNVYAESATYFGVDLDGTNDYINLGTSNRTITNAVTVSAKIKTSMSTVTQYVVDKYVSGTQGFLLTVDANTGKARFDGRDGGTTYKTSGPSITNVADNQWHEITGVVRNTGWEIYVDGVLENTGAYSLGGSGVATATNLVVGMYGTAYSGLTIDKLSIFNTAVTSSLIAQGVVNTCLLGNEPNLVAYYKFDEGTSGTVTDLSQSAITGTLVNTNNTSCWVVTTPGYCNYPTGCTLEMTETISVNVNPTPTITTASSNTLICAGETVTVTASGATTYSWNNGAITADVVLTPTATTIYTVVGTDGNGCSSFSVYSQSVSICTGINNNEESNGIVVFPNPAINEININTNFNFIKADVFNIYGGFVKTVYSNSFTVTDLSEGVYLLEITTDKGIVSKRFVKQ